MKKLMLSAVAMMALASVAHAEINTIWTTSLFGQVSKSIRLPRESTSQRILDLTSDRDNSVNALSVVKDASGAVTALMAQETGPNSAQISFPLSQIEGKDGAVLLEVSGRKALILSGKLNRSTQEGKFTIKYLTNGLWMSYKSCDFNLKKDSKGFFVQNAYNGRAVERVHAVTTSLGITTLQGICP
jgi:hypothetical protein